MNPVEFHRLMDVEKAERARALAEREGQLPAAEESPRVLATPSPERLLGEAQGESGRLAVENSCRSEHSTQLTSPAPQAALAGGGALAEKAAERQARIELPVSTPKDRNRVVLDRGDGRQWTPPPTARQLTQADPFTRTGVKGHSGHRRWVKSSGLGRDA